MQNRSERIIRLLSKIKNDKQSKIDYRLNAVLANKNRIVIEPFTIEDIEKPEIIRLLARWRLLHSIWFPSKFKVTFAGTKKWAENQVIKSDDRILFLIRKQNETKPFGHIGLFRFDFELNSCELDNVVRGRNEAGTKGAITLAVLELINWTYHELKIENLKLRVFGDNYKALNLYRRLGFREIKKISLKKEKNGSVISWIETPEIKPSEAERVFIEMKHIKDVSD